MNVYDIIVVGGGPVGSYTAYQLADLGFEVALFEKDKKVGKNVICTGIVGVDAFKKFDLPRAAIISEIESVTFLSPSLLTLDYVADEPFAYVIDRTLFDKGILRYAKDKGVDVHLGKRVDKVEIGNDLSKIEVYDTNSLTEIRAKAIVLATGVDYKLHEQLGLSLPPSFLQGVQTEAEVKDLVRTEVYFNNPSPGSFAWVVPLDDSTARIGALTKGNSIPHIERFIEARLGNRLNDEDPVIAHKPIAHGPIQKSVNDRVLAVGEAAGQVKTTTGGGIFYGLMCSEIAVQVVKEAFQKGDLSHRQLAKYERLWKSKIGKELEVGYRARKIAESLSRNQIDMMFKFIQRNKRIRGLIKRRVNFEYHSDLLSLGVRLLNGFI